ncbi:MAG: HDIG domain-containing protein [candidate division Zixibacteria bacterium]|nr:HDIG domain-containing protein [candidate division Zixibacteria bacterium]
MKNLFKIKRKLTEILSVYGEGKDDGFLNYLPRFSLGLVVILFITFLFPFEPYQSIFDYQGISPGPWQVLLPIIVRFILILSAVLIFLIFIYLLKREVLENFSQLMMISLLVLAEMALTYFLVFQWNFSSYLIPVTLGSMLLTFLLGYELGLIYSFVIGLLLGIILNFDFNLTFISIVTGSVATISVRGVKERNKFYRPMLYISLSYLVLIYFIETSKGNLPNEILEQCGYGIFNGFFSTILTMGLLPVFEYLFDTTTDITLLELMDLNNPLLKRLTMEAPGTYHHSIVVGNLAEAAAKQLDANPLLSRVGAYYHDIGKIEKPEYFVENQMGVKSKHEKLSPSMSALILESHVKEGVELAERRHLPKKLIDLIKEHHGTTLMTYFYKKALDQKDSKTDEAEFRYPGPKPRSKEAAILMLADAVEAASRTLEDPKPARIMSLIRKIIMDKFEQGELEECELTLKDLHIIEESFLPILIGVFHPRVDYPQLVEEN